jgi:hypothetical protein
MARSLSGVGSADQINCGSGVTDLGSTWSVGGRFLVTTTSGITSVLFARWTNSTTNREINIYLASGKFGVDIPYISAILASPNAPMVGSWHDFVVTRNGSAWVLYVDGAQDTTATNAASGETGATVQIGYSSALGNSQTWPGSLSDFFQSNTAWSTSQVLGFHNGQRPPAIDPVGIAAGGYWPLDGLQSPEPDLSGNKHNGTLTGTASAFGPAVALQTPRRPQYFYVPPQISVSYQRAQQILMTGP